MGVPFGERLFACPVIVNILRAKNDRVKNFSAINDLKTLCRCNKIKTATEKLLGTSAVDPFGADKERDCAKNIIRKRGICYMRKHTISRFFHGLLAAAVCLTFTPLPTASAATVITENKTGTEDGYAYELWKDNGNTSMTLTGGGTFSCEWSNINNCLFRKGKKYDCTQTYDQLGNITIEYGVDYQPNGNSYMCVYGWTRNPLVEYYIVETWGSWRPPGATSALGTVYADGGTYDIYKTTRVNQPSIDGDTTFDQYWSVRQSKPSANGTKIEGTISVSQHFKAWEQVGLKMGKMYEVALNIEGYQSSGKATVYKNNLSVGGAITDPVKPDPVEPDENGYYFHSTFEKNTDGWSSRGDSTVTNSSAAAATGSMSLAVTGRTDTWNGAGYTLDTATFQPGSAYSFSVLAMQDAAASDDFKLSLQYDLNGETNYDTIATATGAKGEWVQLANTAYTIPAGATGLLLYVETADSTNSFYMDEAIGAVKGTKIDAGLPDQPDTPTMGDVDGSGTVDAKDMKTLLNYLIRKTSTLANAEAADLDGNGVINAMDLALLKRSLLGNQGGSTPVTPSESGYFKSTFETGKDGWVSRGDTTLSIDSESYYSGSKSLHISGRTDTWQGAAYTLDTKTFLPGSSYSFSAAAMQASGSSEELRLTLQYTDAGGETAYDTVASATAASKTWTKLENKSYKIPAGASDLLLYVESADSTTDLYLDEAVAAASGTASSVVTGGGKVGNITTPTLAAGTVDISWIDKSKPMAAIAFDDGAVGTATTDYSIRIQDAIANSGFHATFFYVGNWINGSNQGEIKRAYELGMEIANHSTTHTDLTKLSAAEIRKEYDTTSDKIKAITGQGTSPVMRPPYLSVNDTVKSALSDVALVNCSIDTGDWNGATSDQIISKIKTAMSNGTLDNAIVLCHETYDSTATAMEYLAPYLKSQGWQIVTVSELFAANGKELKGGTLYNACN